MSCTGALDIVFVHVYFVSIKPFSLCSCFLIMLDMFFLLLIVRIVSSCQAAAGCKSPAQSTPLQSSPSTSSQTVINHSLCHAKQNTIPNLQCNH